MRQHDPVPRFFLYGEPPREPGRGFLHVEPLALRSRRANWAISEHAHRDLAQMFLVAKGGGSMRVDGQRYRIDAPVLLLIPANAIHGFQWATNSAGQVLSMGLRTLAGATGRAPELARLFATPGVLRLGDDRAARRVDTTLRELAAENAWEAPGRALALDALLVLAMVAALRASGDGNGGDIQGRDTVLIARFRALIEEHFRSHLSLRQYLGTLAVSERRLRDACFRIARRTPMQMVLDRTMLEARRMLVSSNRTAAEIGFQLGYDDPAYFSRVFHAHFGEKLREFRRRAAE